jgi:hypothetical protein
MGLRSQSVTDMSAGSRTQSRSSVRPTEACQCLRRPASRGRSGTVCSLTGSPRSTGTPTTATGTRIPACPPPAARVPAVAAGRPGPTASAAPSGRRNIIPGAGQPDQHLLPQAEGRIVPVTAVDGPDRQACPLRELGSDQPRHQAGCDISLPHGPIVATARARQLPVTACPGSTIRAAAPQATLAAVSSGKAREQPPDADSRPNATPRSPHSGTACTPAVLRAPLIVGGPGQVAGRWNIL